MQMNFCKTTRLVLVLATIALLMICLWQFINAVALLAITGQGWVILFFWAFASFLVAKALPYNSGPRRMFRDLWDKF
jgi:predicted Co/Zn/Cd cation transporter (cation efflux family)